MSLDHFQSLNYCSNPEISCYTNHQCYSPANMLVYGFDFYFFYFCLFHISIFSRKVFLYLSSIDRALHMIVHILICTKKTVYFCCFISFISSMFIGLHSVFFDNQVFPQKKQSQVSARVRVWFNEISVHLKIYLLSVIDLIEYQLF